MVLFANVLGLFYHMVYTAFLRGPFLPFPLPCQPRRAALIVALLILAICIMASNARAPS